MDSSQQLRCCLCYLWWRPGSRGRRPRPSSTSRASPVSAWQARRSRRGSCRNCKVAHVCKRDCRH
eukprot:7544443-Alexandrium_andersonii.AAC.1